MGVVAGGGEWEGNTYVPYIFTAKGLTSYYLGSSPYVQRYDKITIKKFVGGKC